MRETLMTASEEDVVHNNSVNSKCVPVNYFSDYPFLNTYSQI